MKRMITLLAALTLVVACADERKPTEQPKAEQPKAEQPKAEQPTLEPEPEPAEPAPVEDPEPAAAPEEEKAEAAKTVSLLDATTEVREVTRVVKPDGKMTARKDNRTNRKLLVSEKLEDAGSVAVLRDGSVGMGEVSADIMAKSSIGDLSGQAWGEANLSAGGIGVGRAKMDRRASRTRGLVNDPGASPPRRAADGDLGTEEYAKIDENPFKKAVDNPLSTFSIDVDTASYSNVRRFLREGRLPPKDAVRIEELVNYFTYEYPDPTGETPFSVSTELASCPWAPEHHVLMVGLQGRKVDTSEMPKSNLVFLMDVSGSMNRSEKLPLLKSAFRLLVDNLRADDRVAIVVYAGAAGVVLPSTGGNEKPKILEAIERLRAGGSTAGGAGIKLAYSIAKENFIEGGNNRVILATDGDFNVGMSSTGALTRMIEEKREDGIFLTVLGFGRGNYKGSRMESLADKGNGNYAYIDSVKEAKKVLVTEMGGTLLAIAKDVKIQVEFNPAKVSRYRLIGYENRLLAKEDFADDTKDAGELGAGHTVTALYEIVPVDVGGGSAPNDLKYSETKVKDSAKASPELCTVKLRWKKPDGDKSTLEVFPVLDNVRSIAEASGDLRWAASVALFGMALRGSEMAAGAGYPLALEMAQGAVGWDPGGYRTEFLELAKGAKRLAGK